MPPAHVGQVPDTPPDNELQPPSASQTQSAAVSISRCLVVPAVKFEPRCPRRWKKTCKLALSYPTASNRFSQVVLNGRKREAPSWRDYVGGETRNAPTGTLLSRWHQRFA